MTGAVIVNIPGNLANNVLQAMINVDLTVTNQ